jgi:hypothetical protein
VPLVHRESKVTLATKAFKAWQEPLVHKDPQEPLVHKDLKAFRVLLAKQVPQAQELLSKAQLLL